MTSRTIQKTRFFASLGAVALMCTLSAGAQAQEAQGGVEADAESKLSAKAERRARDPIFRADLDISFTYGKVDPRPLDSPHIFGGSVHTRFGLRAWSAPKAAGRIDLGVYSGYRFAAYPTNHPELGQGAKQIGNEHRGFIWGTLGHSFYFTPERRISLGVHGMLGWSHYFLSYTLDDQVSITARAIRQRSNALTAAVHGNIGIGFGPRAGMILSGTYTIPTDPKVAPWSAAIGLNIKLK